MEEKFRVPFSRPDIDEEEANAILKVLRSNWPSQGKVTEEFESMLSQYLSSNVVTVNSGSSALFSALVAHGIKPGDKIVVPAFTFIATASIPKILGADIIVADADPVTLNISPESVEEIVKQHDDVKMVLVVDVGGSPVDIDAFSELAKRYNFVLIEDAAQAFGAEYYNKKVGSFEHTTIFSFQITKQLTTVEGGCIATTDEKILKRISQIKDYGRSKTERYVHDILGLNFRTTDLQSAIGIIQLRKVDGYISNRNKIAREYMKEIKNIYFQSTPKYSTKHVYTLFFAIADDREKRDKYLGSLIAQGIDARKSWTPVHMQPCNPELRSFRCAGAEKIFDCALTLPIYNSMSQDEVTAVIEAFSSSG